MVEHEVTGHTAAHSPAAHSSAAHSPPPMAPSTNVSAASRSIRSPTSNDEKSIHRSLR